MCKKECMMASYSPGLYYPNGISNDDDEIVLSLLEKNHQCVEQLKRQLEESKASAKRQVQISKKNH